MPIGVHEASKLICLGYIEPAWLIGVEAVGNVAGEAVEGDKPLMASLIARRADLSV